MSTQIFITAISATDPMGDRSTRTFATATYPDTDVVEAQFTEMMGADRVDDVFARSFGEGFDVQYYMFGERGYCFVTTTAIDIVA